MCHFRESLFFFFFFLSSYRTSGSSLQARVWVPVVRDWMFQRRLLMCYQYVWLHAAVAGAFSLSLFFFFFLFPSLDTIRSFSLKLTLHPGVACSN